jgi:hypothetical protein
MNALTEMMTMGARITKNYRPTISGLVGQAQAASYDMMGAYATLVELWGSPVDEADENKDGRVSDEEFMKWIDIELGGEGWITPHKFKHPDYGDIWIGGTAKKHVTRTPPARYMEEEALRIAQFVLYTASQFPKVEIEAIEVKPATENLFWVEATVKNASVYPTSSDRSVILRRSVNDRLTIGASPNIQVLDVSAGSTLVEPTDPAGRAQTPKGRTAEFRLGGKQSLKFGYLVKMEGTSGWVEFEAVSKMGGAAKRRIDLTVGR